ARDRPTRVQLYRELIKLTRATLAYADQAATQFWQASDPGVAALWQAEFRHYRPLIEAGNPADSERFLPMLNRHIGFYGEAPRQAAADGGFASRDNLAQAKAL